MHFPLAPCILAARFLMALFAEASKPLALPPAPKALAKAAIATPCWEGLIIILLSALDPVNDMPDST